MSKELTKKRKDNSIIYENDEAKIVFSKARPPHQEMPYIAMTGVCKIPSPDGFKNVPVTIIWNEDKFNELIRDLKEMYP